MILENALVTIDLDSCIADTEHRWHMIDRENGTDWDAYSQACVDDVPVEGVVALVRILVAAGVECHALSGRKVSALPATIAWFQKHDIPITKFWLDESDQGDFKAKSAHTVYKLNRLREVEKITGRKVVLHVDDWAGIATCFNAEGIPTVCVRTPTEIREIATEGHVVSTVGF